MRFTSSSVQLVAGTILGIGALVIACGGDEESTGTTPPAADGGSTSSSGATSSSGSTTPTDGGGGSDAATDAGTGTKNPGEDCKADNECKSGKCWKEDYCTIACTMKDAEDPVCKALGGDFSGKCNKQGFCQKK